MGTPSTHLERLRDRQDVHVILGGACSGKSTACKRLSDTHALTLIDMDARIYGAYQASFTPERFPACASWFGAPNPLQFMLSLSDAGFDQLTRDADAECLALLAEELDGRDDGPFLIDGGFFHPAVVARVIAPQRVACLSVDLHEAQRIWETAPDREPMRAWVRALPDPDRQWQRFLALDRLTSQTMLEESAAAGVRVFTRQPSSPSDALAEKISTHLGIRQTKR